MPYAVKRGFSAMARSDMDVNVLLYEPGTEVWMHGMNSVGVGGCFRGREGVRALIREIDAAFDPWGWTIDRLVDSGDRLAVRGDFVGYGRGSGVKTELTSGGTVMELSSRARSRARSGSSSRTAGSRPSKPLGFRSSAEALLWTEAVA
jgi:hypothetical protein